MASFLADVFVVVQAYGEDINNAKSVNQADRLVREENERMQMQVLRLRPFDSPPGSLRMTPCWGCGETGRCKCSPWVDKGLSFGPVGNERGYNREKIPIRWIMP
jgi:hypothetical protein